jgi:hypothetical protein
MLDFLKRSSESLGVDFLERANERLGGRVYGLPTGLVTHTFARLALYRARRSHPGDSSGFSLPDQPYCFLETQYSSDYIKKLRDAVSKGLESENATVKETDGRVIQKTVTNEEFSFHEHVDMTGIFTDEVKNEIEEYLGTYFKVESARAFKSFQVPSNKHGKLKTTYNWHIDRHSPATVQLFIPLTDVKPEHGPTEIADCSPLKFSESDRYVGALTEVSPDNIIEMTADAGSPYLFTPSRRLHRAGYVEEGKTRYLMFLRLVPDSTPLKENWPEETHYTTNSEYLATGIGQFLNL